MLDAATPVPVPAPAAPPSQPRYRWLWALAGLVVVLVTVAAIRGDAPRTAVVADGSVSPLPVSEDTAVPADARPYIEIDPIGGEELEVCQWDYCVVHDSIGLDRIGAFLYEVSLPEAKAIADGVVDDWDVAPVTVTSRVIPGETGGLYDPNTATITLDEPLIVWSLIHELAHHIVTEHHSPTVDGHGPEFLSTLQSLAGSP